MSHISRCEPLGSTTRLMRQDGVVLAEPMLDALRAGRVHNVAVMNGTTRDEFRHLLSDYPWLGSGGVCNFASKLVPDHQATFPGAITYQTALTNFYGHAEFAAGTIAEYPPGDTPLSVNFAFSANTTDLVYSCRSRRVNNWLTSAGRSVYAYEVGDRRMPDTWRAPIVLHDGVTLPKGAYHAGELQYLFPQAGTISCGMTYSGLSRAQRQLASAMVRYWTTFARTGNPNPTSGLAPPTWPRWTGSGGSMMSLVASTPQVMPVSQFDGNHKCSSFWDVHAPD